MDTLSYGAIVAIVVEVVKRTNVIPARFMGAVAIVFGLGLGYYLQLPVLESLTIGASAIGSYEVVKRGAGEVRTLIK